MERDPVGPADVQYNDWKGTVALDGSDDHDALCNFAHLDHDQWTIVGVDFVGSYKSSWAVVYAVERGTVDSFQDWERVAAENDGLIPVTSFDIHTDANDAGIAAFSLFKRWDVHARLTQAIHDPGFDLVVEREEPPVGVEEEA